MMKKKADRLLPESIQVLGHTVDIVITEAMDELGLSVFNKRKIYISADLDYDQQVETLIHEIFEYANSLLEMNLEHHKICSLEMVLFQSLKSGGLIDV